MKTTDNLLAWEAFVMTARTGSVTRTAVMLDEELTKVSRLLSGLESELGFALFDKRRRPMTPTDEGAALLAKVAPLVLGLRGTVGDVMAGRAKRVIRFAAPTELAQEYFTDLLLKYSAEHPNVTFSIVPPVAADAVCSSEADVAVVSTPKKTDELVVRPYNVSTGIVLATPEYLERFGVPQTPADLSGHVGLLQESLNNRPTRELYRFGESSGPIAWRRVFVSHDQLTLKRMLLENLGIGIDIFPGHVIKEIADGRLVPILLGWHRPPWHMCIATRLADEQKSPALRAFASWLAEVASERMRGVAEEVWRALAEGERRRAELDAQAEQERPSSASADEGR